MNLGKRLRVLEEKFRMHEVNTLAGLGCVPSISMEQPCALEEPTMNTIHVEKTKTYDNERQHLRDAVYDATREKEKEARKHFNIDCADRWGMSSEELVKAIKEDKFKYKEEGKHSKDPAWYIDPINGICLCDPEKEPDHSGLQKVLKMIEKDEEAILLKINVFEPEKAHPDVVKYKEKKYH